MLTHVQKILRFGDFTINPNTASLCCAGRQVPLRPKSFDVLLYLARNPGRVVSKDELMQSVWANVFVTDNSLVQCISDIRAALADDNQAVLKTIARRGYLFAATVVEGSEPATLARDAETESSGGLQATAASPVDHHRSGVFMGFPRPSGWLSIAGGALLVAAGVAWWWGARPAVNVASSQMPGSVSEAQLRLVRPSIAVMPLAALGESHADNYFARGLTEDIIAALGRFAGLTVLSAKTVLPYRDKTLSSFDIGRELKVRYIASGSIRRSPERIRITIQLTDTAGGTLLWADQYDRSPTDIFAVQDDITRRIAGALAVRLTHVEQARAAAKPPDNLEAYDLVLRGRDFLSRLTRSATSKARVMFERAIELDPNYAAAYVGLGNVDLRAIHHGWTPDPASVLQRAKHHALKAITIDEFNPHAHALLGRIHARLREYDQAVDALKRAMALNPSDADNHAGLGDALLWSGDINGAIAALESADQLEPQLSTQDLFNLGAAYFLAAKHAQAVHVLERVAARNEGNPFIHAMLAAIYQDAGRPENARREVAKMRLLNPLFDFDAFGSLFRNPQHGAKIIAALRKASFRSD